jgi:hypothetical protein
MSPFLNGIRVFAISLGVAILGGVGQSIANFHPSDQIGAFVMSTIGAVAIAGINALIHKIQGTAVVKVADTTTKTS